MLRNLAVRLPLCVYLFLGLCPPMTPAVADEPHPALVGVKFHGTMKQIIGTFSTYGHVRVGDVLDLDLAKLPGEKIELTRPNFDPHRDVTPYIPIQNPLSLTKFERGKTGCRRHFDRPHFDG
jgi:hypothetical protein